MGKFNLLRIAVFGTIITCLCLAVSFGQQQKNQRPSLADLLQQRMGGGKSAPASESKGVHEKEFGEEDVELDDEGLEEFEDAEEAYEDDDPNKPKDPFDAIDREAQLEMREWIHGKPENRTVLSRRVQDQVIAELNYIRTFAEMEGAEQTLAAIDKVIASRKDRFDRIAQRIREEQAKAAQNENANTRQNIRGRGATTSGRSRGRGQQQAGPRGRIYQGQQSTRGRQNGY